MAGFDINSMNNWNTPSVDTNITTEGLLNQFNQNNGLTDFSNVSNFSMDGANPEAAGTDWWSKLMGGTNQDGMKTTGLVTGGLGALQGLANSWLGFQQLGLAKDQLGFQKDAFNKNYANNVSLTNSQLEDRQRARVAANPNATAVTDYMNQNRVGG
jgi:hypothetical protein